MTKSKNSKKNQLVSIIVPVYNVENYIKRCLDSIIAQTYSNIEIVLVDDGSTDDSGKICDEYSFIDKRIKTIHKENGGPSSARNEGLRIASGDFFGFVDSDDYIEKDFIEKMLELGDESDVIMCRTIRSLCNKTYIPENFCFEGNVHRLNGREALIGLLDEKLSCSCCDKLFARHLRSFLSFPTGKINEELSVLTNVFLNANKVSYLKSALYHYCMRENSITSTAFDISQFDKMYNSQNVCSSLKKIDKQLYKISKCYYLKQSFYLFKKLVIDKKLKNKFIDQYKYIRKNLFKSSLFILFSKNIKFKQKLSWLYACYLPTIYRINHSSNL